MMGEPTKEGLIEVPKTKKKLLEKYSMLKTFKQVAEEGYQCGRNSKLLENEVISILTKENEELKTRVKDLLKWVDDLGGFL